MAGKTGPLKFFRLSTELDEQFCKLKERIEKRVAGVELSQTEIFRQVISRGIVVLNRELDRAEHKEESQAPATNTAP